MKKIISAVLVSALLIALAACSGGGGGGGVDTSTDTTGPVQVASDMSAVPESMTPEERELAMDTVNAIWMSINTGSVDEDNQALVSYISALPDFADAGIAEDKTVWARFKDGYPAQFVSITVPPGTSWKAPAQDLRRAPSRSQIPLGDKAVLIDVDLLAEGSLNTIDPALTKKGYATTRQRGSMDDFLQIKNTSVLFISSHGGTLTTKAGTLSYSVMTNEKITPYDPTNALSNNLKALYGAGELTRTGVRVRDTNGVLISLPGSFWAVTETFVKNNWSFTANSLVVLDSCEMFLDKQLTTAADKAVYENFRAALTAANAGVIVGWDGQVSPGFASDVMQLFFDRVLGANAYQPENPKQRPFPFKDVHDWLVSESKDRESGGGGLNLQESAAGQLTPSIQRAVVYTPAQGSDHAGEWILELSGDFGTDKSTVSVQGTPLFVHTWAEHNIIAKLPDSMTSPGSSGDVVVEVRGHKSNTLPLTQWTGTVSQHQVNTDIGSGADVSISCPVRATTDVHFNRDKPGDTLKFIGVMVVEVPGVCSYALSGTWSDGSMQYELSGSGTASPTVASKIYGSLLYNSTGSSLPLDFSGGLSPMVTVSGTLKRTDTSVNPATVTTETVYASWTFAQTGLNTTGVTLGADYKLSTSRSCIGLAGTTPIQCTETWNATPLMFSTPTVDTES